MVRELFMIRTSAKAYDDSLSLKDCLEPGPPLQNLNCYASTETRPDIAAAIADPSNDHWLGITSLLRYIKGTLMYGLYIVCCS